MSGVLVVEACARAEARGASAERPVGEVCALLDVEPSTASRIVDRAATAGLVLRTASRVNARRAALVLTDDGRALRARATAARLGWLDAVLAKWSHEDVQVLAAALTRFADAVAATPPAGAGPGSPPRPP